MGKAEQMAAALRGQTDLYTALRTAAAGLDAAQADTILPQVLAALGDTSEADRLRAVDQGLLRAVIRKGAGLPAVAGADRLAALLADLPVAEMFSPPLKDAPQMALLTEGQRPEMPAFSDPAFDAWFAAQRVLYGFGSYGENRSCYQTDQFADRASPERRTRHTGIDVFAPAGTPVFAPLAGRVAWVTYNADPLDYGHTLILKHDVAGQPFWTLYGHLGGSLPDLCKVGDGIAAGQLIAHFGDWHENGGWAAHLHFQIMSDMLQQTGGNFFGVGHVSLWDVWQEICLDPNLILRLPATAYEV